MRILSGVKVLEIAAKGPSPWGAMLLADMGASIIRIERPTADSPNDRLTNQPGAITRGRIAISLDLKKSRDAQKALNLVKKADILIEGMRPGAMERLGLGPTDCHTINPRLIYARMTGWGQDGPLSQVAGHDINYIALTGALHAIGSKDGAPIPPLNLLGDYGGGGAFLVIGILAALLAARKNGQGQVLDVAMIDGIANLMAMPFSRHAAGNWVDQRGSNTLDGGAPWYGVYGTKDNKFVAIGAIEPKFYNCLLDGLGLLHENLPCRDNKYNWTFIRERLASAFKTRSRDDWAAHFKDTDACVTPVLTMEEAPQHPHNVSRETFTSISGEIRPNIAPRFGGTPSSIAASSLSCEEETAAFKLWGLSPE